jgi:hypothetical protein
MNPMPFFKNIYDSKIAPLMARAMTAANTAPKAVSKTAAKPAAKPVAIQKASVKSVRPTPQNANVAQLAVMKQREMSRQAPKGALEGPFTRVPGDRFEYYVTPDRNYPNVCILKWLFAQDEFNTIDIRRNETTVKLFIDGLAFPSELTLRKNDDGMYDLSLTRWSASENYPLVIEKPEGAKLSICGNNNWDKRIQRNLDANTVLHFPLPWSAASFEDGTTRDHVKIAELWTVMTKAAGEQQEAAKIMPAREAAEKVA